MTPLAGASYPGDEGAKRSWAKRAAGTRAAGTRAAGTRAAGTLLVLGLLSCAHAPGVGTAPDVDTAPSPQALTYYNARLALREERPSEALRFWLLRNAIESETRRVSAHDADFRSAVWVALGDSALCPDGFPRDSAAEGGAGLWPLAVHNWVVHTRLRPAPASDRAPFDAFAHGYQRRDVQLEDVLSAKELEALRFSRGDCWQHLLIQQAAGVWSTSLREPDAAAHVLRQLLRSALATVPKDRVVGRAVVAARIFDLNLKLAQLAARKQRKQQREARLRAGVVATSTHDVQAVPLASEEGAILMQSLKWSAEEWMTLSTERRLFLFAHAVRAAPHANTERLRLAIMDALIKRRRGAELEGWLAWWVSGPAEQSASSGERLEALERAVWSGERGAQLLALDLESGFRERAVIALHRGIDALTRGDQAEALRLLAHALRWADDSRDGNTVRNLARRWLSFVAAQFQVTDELLLMLRNVAPRSELSAILEDQVWHAAFAGDAASFERCALHLGTRGALAQRVQLLRPLAQDDAVAFVTTLRTADEKSPQLTTALSKQLLDRLQAEPEPVRVRELPLLRELESLLGESLERAQGRGRSQRKREAVLLQIRALIEGTAGVADDEASRARALSPEREVFVGSLRLAPSDPVPWPFVEPELEAPPVFTPLRLRPEEWAAASGELVFGWRVSD